MRDAVVEMQRNVHAMIDKATLLKARFGVETVEIAGLGEIKVRALTRGEALQVNGTEMDAGQIERKILSWAMVEPALTEAEVKEWQDASPAGEIQEVFKQIVRLSGMEEASAKEAFQGVRDE